MRKLITKEFLEESYPEFIKLIEGHNIIRENTKIFLGPRFSSILIVANKNSNNLEKLENKIDKFIFQHGIIAKVSITTIQLTDEPDGKRIFRLSDLSHNENKRGLDNINFEPSKKLHTENIPNDSSLTSARGIS